MRKNLISEILETGSQFPESKLNNLTIESLEFILMLRKRYAK